MKVFEHELWQTVRDLMDALELPFMCNQYDAYMAQDDIVVQREGVERTREWQHGPLPAPRDCEGMKKPIYVPPEKLPDPCRRCGHDEWLSNGIVLRGKDTKNVVYREKK